MSIGEFIDRHPSLDCFATPLLTINELALENNLQVMADWVSDHGFELMPHGKTTMAPALWRRQLDAGASGITVATPWQARVALLEQIPVVMLANNYLDPHELEWAVAHLERHPEQSLLVWADSMDAVDWLNESLTRLGANRPLGVLVELGAAGGRTGARTIDTATAIATQVNRSPHLELCGVAGYEGALGHDRSVAAVTRVGEYLDSLQDLFVAVRGLAETDKPIISAGGSAFFDIVADRLSPIADGTCRVVLRSGAYLIHDDGFYARISPLGRNAGGDRPQFVPAADGWARVLSRPEPQLALLDGGKRDFPYDEGLPVCVSCGPTISVAGQSLVDRPVTAMNDQHSFVSVEAGELPVGALVRLGLSHPCTMFDKWRLVPVIKDDSNLVIDVIETYF